MLSYEKFSLDVLGIGLEFAIVPEGTRSFYRQFDPNADFEYGNYRLSTDFPRVTRIDIDTGAFATGRLTCLVLEGEERRFLST